MIVINVVIGGYSGEDMKWLAHVIVDGIRQFMHKTHAFEKIVIAMITFDIFFVLS